MFEKSTGAFLLNDMSFPSQNSGLFSPEIPVCVSILSLVVFGDIVCSGKWQNTKTAFLCHNAVFQGRFAREDPDDC